MIDALLKVKTRRHSCVLVGDNGTVSRRYPRHRGTVRHRGSHALLKDVNGILHVLTLFTILVAFCRILACNAGVCL